MSSLVLKVPTLHERKDQKELQELCVRILDHLGHTAGLCLEQTAWLRPRTVVVKNDESEPETVREPRVDPHFITKDPVDDALSGVFVPTDVKKVVGERKVREDDPLFLNPTEEDALRKANAARVKTIKDAERSVSEQCLGALKLLAGCLASFLDVLYASDEKERVVPILTSLLTNVTPYLKNHR